MLDPLSFAAGGFTVIVGKLFLNAISSSNPVDERTLPPLPPPPPKSNVRIRLFVKDMGSLLKTKADDVYVQSDDTKNESKNEVKTLQVIKTSLTVNLKDILQVKLRPIVVQTKQSQKTNPAPFFTDCILQKTKLRHVSKT